VTGASRAGGARLDLPAGFAGATAGPRAQDIDARWLMAYAAALGETAPEYLDTLRPEGIRAHPLFPVCYEWPPAVELRTRALHPEVAARGVHATHDLDLHRPIRPGDRLSTTATVVAVGLRRPGAFVLTRFDTVDAGGEPVTTTHAGTLYLGVGCAASAAPGGRGAPDLPPAAEARAPHRPRWTATLPLPRTAAHVYTECARIWNPIHTDPAVARAAGLPDIILHGTATLAMAVSEVLRREAKGAATAVRRIACRFEGMVRLPSTVTVEGLGVEDGPDGRQLRFRAVAADGRPAVAHGLVVAGDDHHRKDGRP
jgi:acyl dehydratase